MIDGLFAHVQLCYGTIKILIRLLSEEVHRY